MKIGVIGAEANALGLSSVEGFVGELAPVTEPKLGNFDILLVFEGLESQNPIFSSLSSFEGIVGLNSVYGSALTQMKETGIAPKKVFSFLGLKGFLQRKEFEIGIPHDDQKQDILAAIESSGLDPIPVLDRVGLVSGRVMAMIINEAYFTVMEGTANKEDIDVAMKLGTNYPFGPFELVENSGKSEILELLLNLHSESRDERYKPCPLLRDEVLKENKS